MCVAVLAPFSDGSLLPNRAFAADATINAYTGQTCAGTRFGGNLNCTSNDFSSSLTFDQDAATAIANCQYGETVTLDVLAATTSNSPIRYDGAYFIGENGISPSLNSGTSSCSVGVFPLTPSPFLNNDGDSCGDYAATSTSALLIKNVKVKCVPVAGTNSLAIPYVLVFNNQTGATACTPANVTANTTAKCVSSTTASVTGVSVNGWVKVIKQTLPDTEPGSFSFAASSSVTPSPASASLSDGNEQVFQVPFTGSGGGRAVTIVESALAGWDPVTSIACVSPTGGAASYVTVNNTTRTLVANLTTTDFGAVCTFTNTKKAKLTFQKQTSGGVFGPISFAQANLSSNPPSVTTTAANTPVPTTPATIEVTTHGAVVTITEVTDPDYFLSGFTCTDSNSTRTGNTGTLGSFSGATMTVAASRVVAGADFQCLATNTLSAPAITVAKSSATTSVSAAGTSITYTITVVNTGNVLLPSLAVADPLGSVICTGTGTSSIANLGVASQTTCTVTYVVPQNVLDNNGGGDGDIDNAATVTGTLGSHSLNQTDTHSIPLVLTRQITLLKTASTAGPVAVGNTITYTFAIKNTGNITISNVGLSDVHNGLGLAPVPGNESLYNDAGLLGDSVDAATNGTWDSLAPGDTIRFTSLYQVVQDDIDYRQ